MSAPDNNTRIPPLLGEENLEEWVNMIDLALRAEGLLGMIGGAVANSGTSAAATTTPDNDADYELKRARVLFLIACSISPVRAWLLNQGWDANEADPRRYLDSIVDCFVRHTLATLPAMLREAPQLDRAKFDTTAAYQQRVQFLRRQFFRAEVLQGDAGEHQMLQWAIDGLRARYPAIHNELVMDLAAPGIHPRKLNWERLMAQLAHMDAQETTGLPAVYALMPRAMGNPQQLMVVNQVQSRLQNPARIQSPSFFHSPAGEGQMQSRDPMQNPPLFLFGPGQVVQNQNQSQMVLQDPSSLPFSSVTEQVQNQARMQNPSFFHSPTGDGQLQSQVQQMQNPFLFLSGADQLQNQPQMMQNHSLAFSGLGQVQNQAGIQNPLVFPAGGQMGQMQNPSFSSLPGVGGVQQQMQTPSFSPGGGQMQDLPPMPNLNPPSYFFSDGAEAQRQQGKGKGKERET